MIEPHQSFVRAFRVAYDARFAAEPDLLDRYKGSDWTRVMLGGKGETPGILVAAAQGYADGAGQLCSGHTQWYTLDLLLVAPPFADKTEYWQTKSLIAIEHENGDDVETEMWKLAHWRAPLSVCVFYDFNESKLDDKIYNGDRTIPGVMRKDWLARKLKLLSGIVQRVDADSADRHLLIIGNRMRGGSLRWRASSWKDGAFSEPADIT